MGHGFSGDPQKNNHRQEENAGRYRNKHLFGILASRGADANQRRPALVRAGLHISFTHPCGWPWSPAPDSVSGPLLLFPQIPGVDSHASVRYLLKQPLPDEASPACGTQTLPSAVP